MRHCIPNRKLEPWGSTIYTGFVATPPMGGQWTHYVFRDKDTPLFKMPHHLFKCQNPYGIKKTQRIRAEKTLEFGDTIEFTIEHENSYIIFDYEKSLQMHETDCNYDMFLVRTVCILPPIEKDPLHCWSELFGMLELDREKAIELHERAEPDVPIYSWASIDIKPDGQRPDELWIHAQFFRFIEIAVDQRKLTWETEWNTDNPNRQPTNSRYKWSSSDDDDDELDIIEKKEEQILDVKLKLEGVLIGPKELYCRELKENRVYIGLWMKREGGGEEEEDKTWDPECLGWRCTFDAYFNDVRQVYVAYYYEFGNDWTDYICDVILPENELDPTLLGVTILPSETWGTLYKTYFGLVADRNRTLGTLPYMFAHEALADFMEEEKQRQREERQRQREERQNGEEGRQAKKKGGQGQQNGTEAVVGEEEEEGEEADGAQQEETHEDEEEELEEEYMGEVMIYIEDKNPAPGKLCRFECYEELPEDTKKLVDKANELAANETIEFDGMVYNSHLRLVYAPKYPNQRILVPFDSIRYCPAGYWFNFEAKYVPEKGVHEILGGTEDKSREIVPNSKLAQFRKGTQYEFKIDVVRSTAEFAKDFLYNDMFGFIPDPKKVFSTTKRKKKYKVIVSEDKRKADGGTLFKLDRMARPNEQMKNERKPKKGPIPYNEDFNDKDGQKEADEKGEENENNGEQYDDEGSEDEIGLGSEDDPDPEEERTKYVSQVDYLQECSIRERKLRARQRRREKDRLEKQMRELQWSREDCGDDEQGKRNGEARKMNGGGPQPGPSTSGAASIASGVTKAPSKKSAF